MIQLLRAAYYPNFKNAEYCALSTDLTTLPTYLKNGDKIYVIDTGKKYIYNSASGEIVEEIIGGDVVLAGDLIINNGTADEASMTYVANSVKNITGGGYATGTGLVPVSSSVSGGYITGWQFADLGGYTEHVTSSVASIQAVANTTYICGECLSVLFSLPMDGVVDLIFTSGSTPTDLNVSSSDTIRYPDWFNPTALETNRTYEMNFLCDSTSGMVYVGVMSWQAS